MKLNKTAVLTSVGAGLEYYDFVVYAFLAQYIGYLFFLHTIIMFQLLQLSVFLPSATLCDR